MSKKTLEYGSALSIVIGLIVMTVFITLGCDYKCNSLVLIGGLGSFAISLIIANYFAIELERRIINNKRTRKCKR